MEIGVTSLPRNLSLKHRKGSRLKDYDKMATTTQTNKMLSKVQITFQLSIAGLVRNVIALGLP